MGKDSVPLTDGGPGLQESRREMSAQEDVLQQSCDSRPCGSSSPPGWLAPIHRCPEPSQDAAAKRLKHFPEVEPPLTRMKLSNHTPMRT